MVILVLFTVPKFDDVKYRHSNSSFDTCLPVQSYRVAHVVVKFLYFFLTENYPAHILRLNDCCLEVFYGRLVVVEK